MSADGKVVKAGHNKAGLDQAPPRSHDGDMKARFKKTNTVRSGAHAIGRGFAGSLGIGYAIFASLWIYASDTLLEGLSLTVAGGEKAQLYKGWLFVAVSALLLYGTVLAVVRRTRAESRTTPVPLVLPMTEELPRPWTQHATVPLLIFVALAAAIGLAGWSTYVHERAALRHAKNTSISTVADFKVTQISNWLDDCKSQVRLLGSDPFFAAALRTWLADGAEVGGRRDKLIDWLRTQKQALGYDSIAVIDSIGRVLLSSGTVVLSQEIYDRIAAAQASGDVVLSDLYRVDGAESGSSVALDIIMPLSAVSTTPGPAAELALVRIDAAKFLFPLLQHWPISGPTAETLLARREGNEILFMNRPRLSSATPMMLRRSVDEPDLPSAKFLRGITEAGEGVDYRGIPVLAAVRQVPGTNWIIIAKVERDEVYAPLRRIALATGLVVAVCILASGIGIILWWSHQRARWQAASLRTWLERQALLRHFDYLSKYANDIILLSDERGLLVEVNRRAEQAYGLSRAELIGRPAATLQDPLSRSTEHTQADKLKTSEGLVFETQHRRANGARFPVEISTRIIDVEGRQFRHSIVRDISDRLAAEQRVRELDEQLRRLGIATELGQMVSSLAHELRQPLTAAMNYINACRRLLLTQSSAPPKVLAAADKARDQIERADRLVRDMRAFIQNRAPECTMEDICTLVDETMEIALIGTGHLGLVVRCSYAADLPPVRADRVRVQHVLLNLLRNAVEAMMGTERREVGVDIRLRTPEEMQVSILDTGSGITPEVAKHLFEPFVTSKTGGIGIGLSLCRSIIEAHGGRLWAEEAPAAGTIFRFTLPVATAVQPEAP